MKFEEFGVEKKEDKPQLEVENFQEHPIILGIYKGLFGKKDYYPFPHFIFADIEAPLYEFVVPAYANLKYQLKYVKKGTPLKIVYTGDTQFKGHKMKMFKLYEGK